MSDKYEIAIKALDGITAVMVERIAYYGGGEEAGVLINVSGNRAVVKLLDGYRAGQVCVYPVTKVRPAEPSEVTP